MINIFQFYETKNSLDNTNHNTKPCTELLIIIHHFEPVY